MNLDGAEIIDISPVISEDLAVFPGDMPFSLETSMSYPMGHHLMLSSIRSTLHLGAHTDAPCHYHKDGETMEKRALSYYIGPCQVIELSNIPEITTPRVLIKTESYPNPDKWNGDFASVPAKLIGELNEKGVKLIGIDTPSVDPASSKTLDAHKKIYEYDMAILEGIVLTNVTPGNYNLIALPLKMKGADASPVRAILLRDTHG